jgi:hypothetical protein
LREKGFSSTWRLDPAADLKMTEATAGLETLQGRITPEVTKKIVQSKPAADVLLVRHVLEHAHHPRSFVNALKNLVRPGGILVVEAPDCRRGLASSDCTMLWEEHTLYFTPASLKSFLTRCGLSEVGFEIFPYPLENSLVGLFRWDPAALSAEPKAPKITDELDRAEAFSSGIPRKKKEWKEKLTRANKKGPVALFGAGHSSAMFVAVNNLASQFGFVVDDNPHKKDCLLPGTKLPIRPSSALMEEKVKTCFVAASPESADKIRSKNEGFLKQGGQFESIFELETRS